MNGSLQVVQWFSRSTWTLLSMRACSTSSWALMQSILSPFLQSGHPRQRTHLYDISVPAASTSSNNLKRLGCLFPANASTSDPLTGNEWERTGSPGSGFLRFRGLYWPVLRLSGSVTEGGSKSKAKQSVWGFPKSDVFKLRRCISRGGTVTVHCNKCNSNQDCTEQSSFLNLPDVLIFRIRRDQFMGGQGAYRSGRQMEYERHLTIGSREGENITPTTYHLVAVSHHVRQSFSSSHYTTTLIDPRKRNLMWKYDDEIVSETKVLDNRTSFILFYRKERRR